MNSAYALGLIWCSTKLDDDEGDVGDFDLSLPKPLR